MSEEAKEKKVGEALKTGGKIIIGVVLVILGILAIVGWRADLLTLIKGGLGLVLVAAGAITIAIAKE